MATLHLIGGSSGGAWGTCDAPVGAMRACAAMIAGDHAQPGGHRVLLVGDRLARQDAAIAGLRVDGVVSPPLGARWLAWPAVRRQRGVSRVVVWTPGLDAAARTIGAPVEVTAWARAGGPGAGATRARDLAVPPAEVRPGLTREEVRASIGVAPRERVVMLLADPPVEGDARRFAFLIGLLEVGIGPVVGVMSSGSSQLARGRRFHRLTVRQSPLLVVEGGMLPWVAGADVAVVEGSGGIASRSAVQAALRADVPVLGPAWALEDDSSESKRVQVTDGRTRTLLPAVLLALGIPPDLPCESAGVGASSRAGPGATIA